MMPIEGPLRELSIHDVFQLLDLSRKTGRLRVSSTLRNNEGTVHFRGGRVIGASIRSNPHPIGQILLRAGKITEEELERACSIHGRPGESRRLGDILVDLGFVTRRELERQIRRQIEAVLFELLSWQEGWFSFVEEEEGDGDLDPESGLSVESVLMEAARRIDEWTRITDLIPDLACIPMLADAPLERQARLELTPMEWQVLGAVDGHTDIRGIAAEVGISDFDAAKIVYGLLTTGVVTLAGGGRAKEPTPDASALLAQARDALLRGELNTAVSAWRRLLLLYPHDERAALARSALEQAARLKELAEVR
ncbi:MAG TPA: DUF4388 domain-containing protein [Gemmatimonadaceae bacterium]|nr:DUF4388 domain-containing protein [Gemmatimonadaceae bacterium]